MAISAASGSAAAEHANDPIPTHCVPACRKGLITALVAVVLFGVGIFAAMSTPQGITMRVGAEGHVTTQPAC